MAEVFPVERIPAEVGKIASRLRDSGFEVWYVGGAVRDVLLELLLGQSAARVGDFDIATSARPEQVQALFRRTVPVGIEHGTVAVLDQSGIAHEVTTFRKDVKTDGRHAEVEFGVTLEDDLARRDFTINAVAVHPLSGEIRDPFGGRQDLRARVVRAVGDPAMRFREDRLRVLRALRFAAALGFALDPATWDALVAAASDLEHLSRERVRDEWLKMLATSLPSAGVGLWRRAGVWREVWPELADFDGRAEGALDEIEPRDPVLLTAAALGYVAGGSDAAAAAVRRLRFSSRDVERVRWVVGGLAEPLPAPGATREVRRWLSRHRASARDIIAVSEPRARRADLLVAVEAVIASGDAIGIRDLAVTGDDLQAAGLAPGKAMGEVLRRLLDEVLDEPWRNTREHLLARARELS